MVNLSFHGIYTAWAHQPRNGNGKGEMVCCSRINPRWYGLANSAPLACCKAVNEKRPSASRSSLIDTAHCCEPNLQKFSIIFICFYPPPPPKKEEKKDNGALGNALRWQPYLLLALTSLKRLVSSSFDISDLYGIDERFDLFVCLIARHSMLTPKSKALPTLCCCQLT